MSYLWVEMTTDKAERVEQWRRDRKRLWQVTLPKPEREALKRLAKRQGLPVRTYAGLVLRMQIKSPRPVELVPLLSIPSKEKE